MRTNSYEQINELIKPLMDVMRDDYPNNAELVISADYATIRYTLNDMSFMRRDISIEVDATKAMDVFKSMFEEAFGFKNEPDPE